MSLSVNVSAQESVMVPLARIPTDEADGKVVNSMRSSASAAKPQIEKRRVRRPGLDDAGRVRVLPDERTRAHLENARSNRIESIELFGEGGSLCVACHDGQVVAIRSLRHVGYVRWASRHVSS